MLAGNVVALLSPLVLVPIFTALFGLVSVILANIFSVRPS